MHMALGGKIKIKKKKIRRISVIIIIMTLIFQIYTLTTFQKTYVQIRDKGYDFDHSGYITTFSEISEAQAQLDNIVLLEEELAKVIAKAESENLKLDHIINSEQTIEEKIQAITKITNENLSLAEYETQITNDIALLKESDANLENIAFLEKSFLETQTQEIDENIKKSIYIRILTDISLLSNEEIALPTCPNPTYVNDILILSPYYCAPSNFGPDEQSQLAEDQLGLLLDQAKAENINIKTTSSFRDYYYQVEVYSGWISSLGFEEAKKVSAVPGFSEHQSGLAFDIAGENDICTLNTCFSDTPEGEWIAANAHNFGFIIRYPEGQEAITGYTYEPWHLRYVGQEHATKIYEQGVTLEEYLGIDF